MTGNAARFDLWLATDAEAQRIERDPPEQLEFAIGTEPEQQSSPTPSSAPVEGRRSVTKQKEMA